MAYVIVDTCIDCKDASCVSCCPVDCIYEGPRSFYIHPDECINCGICVPLCPVNCIHDARQEGVVEGAGGYTRILELQAWAQQSG